MSFRLTANRAVFLFSLYCAAVFNFGFWKQVAAAGDTVLLLTMPLFLVAAMNLIFQLLFWPKAHRVMIPLLLLIGAAASYAVTVQHIYFNADMMQNVLQTDRNEASAWLSWKFIGWTALTGLLPALLYLRFGKIRSEGVWYRKLGWRAASVAASLAVIGLLAATSYSHYASFFRNNKGLNHRIVPTNVLGSAFKTAYNLYDASRPFETIGSDAKRMMPSENGRKRVTVLVVGETARAQNWGLNAGAPDTTPKLKQVAGLINFPDVSSCGTATAISVPCMFSPMARADYDGNRAKHQENVLDILQRSGIGLQWRENDSGCKGVCQRIRHIDVAALATDGSCGEEGCHDMALLAKLDEEIRQMPSESLIILHTIGSHGPTYYQRYPAEFRAFTPTCDTKQIQDCSREALVNTYNNTLRYTDHVLSSAIALLQKQENTDTALWYLSDHGESLGENGLYLHAAPYAVAPKEQTHVPMVFWANEGWWQSTGIAPSCLAERAKLPHSHDNLFHSLLGLYHIQTSLYRADLDMFAACRKTG